MRILFLSNLHPLPWQPGRGVFNQRMIGALREAGHDVRVMIPVNLAEHRRLSIPRAADATLLPFIALPRVLRHRSDAMAWLAFGRTLEREARAFRPDVILSFWVHPDGAVALRLARRIGVPAAVMAGGSDLRVITRDRARRRAVRGVLQQAAAVLTNGDRLRDTAIELGAAPGRTHAFRRGVSRAFMPGDRQAARELVGLPVDARIALFVGNMVPVKGPDVLVEALARVGDDAPWHVAWLGDGPMLDTIRRRIAGLPLAPRMHLMGRVPHDALPEWMRAADLVVLPSRSEGVPNVLMEAAATGVPFIASDVGGVAEVGADPACLVRPDDPDALAAALARAWTTPVPVALPPPTEEAMARRITAVLHDLIARPAR